MSWLRLELAAFARCASLGDMLASHAASLPQKKKKLQNYCSARIIKGRIDEAG